jgi:hypothetical protein
VREATVRRVRRQAEEGLRRHAQRLKILHGIDRAILAAQSSEAIAPDLTPLRAESDGQDHGATFAVV